MNRKLIKMLFFIMAFILIAATIFRSSEVEDDNLKPNYLWAYGNYLETNWYREELSDKDLKNLILEDENIVNENRNNVEYGKAIINLTNRYLDIGETDKAKEIIQRGSNSNNAGRISAKIAEIIYLSRTNSKDDALNKALELYRDIESYYTENILITTLLLCNRYNDAERVINKSQFSIDSKTTFFSSKEDKILEEYYSVMDTYNFRKSYLNLVENSYIQEEPKGLELEVGTSTIYGKLTYGDNPLPYTLVALYKSSNAGVEENFSLITYTDHNGEYKFENLPKGEFYIAEKLPLNILYDWTIMYPNTELSNDRVISIKNDKSEINYNTTLTKKIKLLSESSNKLTGENFNIKWTPIEGAKRYDVSIYVYVGDFYNTEGYSLVKYRDISETEFNLPLVGSSIMSIPIFIDNITPLDNITSFDKRGVNYSGLIDFRDIGIVVTPKDEYGEIMQGNTWYKTITSKFKIDAKDLNRGDNLLQNDNIVEALRWYGKQIEVEGYKKEYLYPIIRYYCINNKEYKQKEIFNLLLDELYKINNNPYEIELYRNLYEKGIFQSFE